MVSNSLYVLTRRRGADTAHTQMGRPTYEAPTREYTHKIRDKIRLLSYLTYLSYTHKHTNTNKHTTWPDIYMARTFNIYMATHSYGKNFQRVQLVVRNVAERSGAADLRGASQPRAESDGPQRPKLPPPSLPTLSYHPSPPCPIRFLWKY